MLFGGIEYDVLIVELDAVYAVSLKETEDQFIIVTGGGDEFATLTTYSKESIAKAEESIILSEYGRKYEGHADSIAATGWNFDQTILATADMEGVVQLWKDEEEPVVLQGPSDSIEVGIICIGWSSDW